jgi:hypothetical protein
MVIDGREKVLGMPRQQTKIFLPGSPPHGCMSNVKTLSLPATTSALNGVVW